MSGDLNLKKDRSVKPKSNKKSIIATVVGLIVVVAIIVGTCLYINSKEVDAFNKDVDSLHNLAKQLNNNNTKTSSQYENYETQFQNLANEFKSFEKDFLFGQQNIGTAKNNSDIAEYISNREGVEAGYYKILEKYNLNGTLAPNQIQDIINQMQTLLTSNNFVQMNNIYNESSYVQQKATGKLSPEGVRSIINGAVAKLSEAETDENVVNGLADCFGVAEPYADTQTAPAVNNQNSSTNSNNDSNVNTSSNNDSNNSSTSSSNASNNNTNDNSSANASNNSNKPVYMQNLAALSTKYGNLVDNALTQYGNSGNLMLSSNKAENEPIIKGYYNTWNTILNDVWGDLKNNLPASQMAQLTKEEEAWVNSKNGKTSAEQAQMTERQAMKLLNKYIYQYKNQ